MLSRRQASGSSGTEDLGHRFSYFGALAIFPHKYNDLDNIGVAFCVTMG